MVCLMRAVVCVTQARRHTSQSWVVFTSTKKYFEVSRFLWNEMKLAEVAERRCGHLQRISHITSCYIRVVACYIRGVAWLTHTPHCSHQTDHRSGRSQNGQTATIIIIWKAISHWYNPIYYMPLTRMHICDLSRNLHETRSSNTRLLHMFMYLTCVDDDIWVKIIDFL